MARTMTIALRSITGPLLLLTAPAIAQAPDPADSITVTGERPATRSEVSRQADAITPLAGNPRRNPLARFERPVCPGVMGMPEELAELLVLRVRFVAQQAGLELAPENACNPNIIIAFVRDPQIGLEQVERALPEMFERLSLAERRSQWAQQGPVRVVTASSERTSDGFIIPERMGGAPPVVNIPQGVSRTSLTTREDIESVVVLIAAPAVDGMSIHQLGDYAAMRSLAETRPPDAETLAMDTILTLFEPDASPPGALTDFDLAYLRSLYDGIPNRSASTRILGLNRQLRQMTQEEAAEDETSPPR